MSAPLQEGYAEPLGHLDRPKANSTSAFGIVRRKNKRRRA